MPFAVKCLPDTFIVASTDILVGNRYKLCKLTSKLFSLKIRSLKNFYITFIIVYMPWHTCGGQRTICGRLVTSSTLCVSGIQLRTSGLAQLLYSLRHPASSKFIKTLNILNPHTGTKTTSMHTSGPFFSKGQGFLLPL